MQRAWVLSCFSCVPLFATLWTVATRLLCPWNSPGKNTGVGSYSFFQWIFWSWGLNPVLSHCRQILYRLSHQGSPSNEIPWINLKEWSQYMCISIPTWKNCWGILIRKKKERKQTNKKKAWWLYNSIDLTAAFRYFFLWRLCMVCWS